MKPADLVEKSLPWLTGSGVALSQGLLATACSVPKIGTCAGCGSCIIAVATFTGLALKKRRENREQVLEPFEICTRND